MRRRGRSRDDDDEARARDRDYGIGVARLVARAATVRRPADAGGLADRFTALLLDGMRGYSS